jgi:acetylornithine/N-succinyldiaminopimelate aminotransferase
MDLVKLALENGLIVNCTANTVIRIMPPLNIDKDVFVKGLELFSKLVKEYLK